MGDLASAGMLGGSDRATRISKLTGSLSSAERKTALAEIKNGSAGIVIGTHSLLTEGVDFADLGLVIIDEQHRFELNNEMHFVRKVIYLRTFW